MKLLLIRHGMTLGNQQKKYIGITDDVLSGQGKKQVCILREHLYQNSDISKLLEKTYAVISPMKRCVETARLLGVGQAVDGESECKTWVLEEDLRECNFGLFENKNYLELKDEPLYQQWIDSNGTMDFPEGDCLLKWKERCVKAFLYHLNKAQKQGFEQMIFVIHGGSIMAIMERLEEKQLGYYDYHVDNGDGFFCEYVGSRICSSRKLLC